jgi:imidazolonepropionase-like amidohydrolase
MAQGDGLLTSAQIEKAMIVGVKIKEALARSHKAGVTIAFGTDMGVGPHGQNAREFGFMVEAGMRSREAIKAATVNAATLLDLADEVGTIASGKSADVIAVDSSPLDDVSVLQRMAFVMARRRLSGRDLVPADALRMGVRPASAGSAQRRYRRTRVASGRLTKVRIRLPPAESQVRT